MVPNLSFELLLLDRMSPSYKAATLCEIGLTELEAGRIRGQSTFKIPEQLGSDINTYSRLIGPEFRSEELGDEVPEVFAGSRAHYFLLMLWPHLYWVVNRRPDGATWGPGFQNQGALKYEQVDPSLVRVGLWTRSALQRLADRYELYDGWDEQVVVHFGFGSHRYVGRFVFDLLQEWRELR